MRAEAEGRGAAETPKRRLRRDSQPHCGRRPAPPIALLAGLLVACASAIPAPIDPNAPALRIATSGDYRPYSLRTASGRVGFDIALAEAFAEHLGRPIEWVDFSWPELASDSAAGRFDVAMSGVTVRPDRSLVGRFSLPVAESGAVALVANPEFFASLEALDAPGVRIAVNEGGHLEKVAREHFGRAQILSFANARVIAALARGAVDAVVTDTGEAPHWQDRVPGSRVLGPFTRDRKALLVRADAPELARSLDRWLLASERRGLLGDLRHEHLGAAGPRTATPLAALLAAIDERLSLMPYVAEAKRATSSAIADPAREQRVLAAARERVEAACAERGLEPRMAPCSVRREEVRGLFLSLIGAAKDVQRRVLAGPPDPDKARDLDGEIRPALLRIGDRLAWLAVRLPNSLERNSVRARTRRALERHDLRAARVMQIADAIVALASRETDAHSAN